MNSKNIAKVLKKKMDDWCNHIENEEVRKIVKENAIITGGALVSLLIGDVPNDYDIYFKSAESCVKIAEYYAVKWNENHRDKNLVEIRFDEANKRITAFISNVGIAAEEGEDGIDDETEPDTFEAPEEINNVDERPKYRPRYFSTNAISLSDKIQLVIRFCGPVEEIHENYDFVHCTCSYDYKENKVILPARALEAIINKELYYCGSKYPLCSIIRSRKFIQRGWHINAGQYLKMCLQLDELNLKDFNVFVDQLAGVDSAYFNAAITAIKKRQDEDPDFKIDNTYLFEVINRIF